MGYELEGPWRRGLAFDVHTVDSVYLGVDEHGHDRFQNTRSEMGELVYRLKYQGERDAAEKIVELLRRIRGIENYDFLIPVPSSKARASQPVDVIAERLGKQRGVPVLTGFLRKGPGGELKGIEDPDERASALSAISIASDVNVTGKRVMLVDDLYRSGATLSACTKVLYEQAKASDVVVLTMTKTRTKR